LEDLVGVDAASVEDDVEESNRAGTRGRMTARRLSHLIPKAELRCQKASKELVELVLSYEGRMRVPESLARERHYRTISFNMISEIFWRPETGYCFIQDLPRRAINAATWLLSTAVLGYPGRLSPYELDSNQMREIVGYLTKRGRGGAGELVRAVFGDVKINQSQLEVVSLKSRELHSHPHYSTIEKGARQIRSINFITPLIKETGRSYACRLDARGSVQIYGPRLSSSAFRAVLSFFEEVLSRET
jgi:hypothetical protein